MRIEPLDAAELGRLEPLWLELHSHHQVVARELAPYVGDAASWSVRGALYENVLTKGGFAFIAREGAVDVGYAMAAIEPAAWPATFATADKVAELLTLSVHPGLRGRGIGSALMDAVDARLATAGRDDRMIGVVPANVRASALYARRGYLPTWLTLTRFGRPPATTARTTATPIEAVLPHEIDALAPLWLSLHHHHKAIAPELGPFVPDAASWETMRELLASSALDGLLLRAGPPAAPLAMACVSVARDDPLWADTWTTGREVAEIKLLVVDDAARGAGLGSALLDAVDTHLAGAGVNDQVIGVIEPNQDAIRLYVRRGFRPAWLQMTRFAGNSHSRPQGRAQQGRFRPSTCPDPEGPRLTGLRRTL
jgi:ribosomal protein S18 acetylase RimI-like enzyme